MSTYNTNELQFDHPAKRTYVQDGKEVIKDFYHPEVVSSHFKYYHTVDDHNTKRHSPICFEYVWAT